MFIRSRLPQGVELLKDGPAGLRVPPTPWSIVDDLPTPQPTRRRDSSAVIERVYYNAITSFFVPKKAGARYGLTRRPGAGVVTGPARRRKRLICWQVETRQSCKSMYEKNSAWEPLRAPGALGVGW
jgi:hypothetical protein